MITSTVMLILLFSVYLYPIMSRSKYNNGETGAWRENERALGIVFTIDSFSGTGK